MHTSSSLHPFRAALICCLLLASATFARAADTLPLDRKASSLTFVGEAFLHHFQGEARDFSGHAVLNTGPMPPVQKAVLRFKTAALTTFNKARDKDMREWLQIETHPDAIFSLESVKLLDGDAQAADAAHPAKFSVTGELRFHGTKQPITGTAFGWREKDRLIVTGDTVVDTLQYGLPQVRKAFLTVGTNVKTSYRFVFILPAEYARK